MELGAAPRALIAPDPPTVAFHDPPADRQPDSHARDRVDAAAALEQLEQLLFILVGNSDPAVGDGDEPRSGAKLRLHRHHRLAL